jgi:hypothetical protein
VCTDFASSSQLHHERDPLCALPGARFPYAVKDIINDREKLKETEEYKQAMEEEWAARQQQLQIQVYSYISSLICRRALCCATET